MRFELKNKANALQRPSPRVLEEAASIAAFANDVRLGLGSERKKLPAQYFYDELGSTLFEAITLLPEYGLTRADTRLLRKHANDLIRWNKRPSVIAELGSGSGTKTRFVLEAVREPKTTIYCPIDTSPSALDKCELELRRFTEVEIHRIDDSYLAGLERATRLRRETTSILVLFLGSTIGNFDPQDAERFCRDVRALLKEGDTFLLSTDLEKPVKRVVAAYDDALGITAAFNLNLLVRINRELGGNFDLSKFRHVARYDDRARRIEMHLESRANQKVTLDHDFVANFGEGETIWTESSYKFRPEDISALAESTGFRCEAQWIDAEWPFAQSVLRAV